MQVAYTAAGFRELRTRDSPLRLEQGCMRVDRGVVNDFDDQTAERRPAARASRISCSTRLGVTVRTPLLPSALIPRAAAGIRSSATLRRTASDLFGVGVTASGTCELSRWTRFGRNFARPAARWS